VQSKNGIDRCGIINLSQTPAQACKARKLDVLTEKDINILDLLTINTGQQHALLLERAKDSKVRLLSSRFSDYKYHFSPISNIPKYGG
jgi:hypothetical protein